MDDLAQGQISSRVAPVQFLFRATGPGIGRFLDGDTAPGSRGESESHGLMETVDNSRWGLSVLGLEVPEREAGISSDVVFTVGASVNRPVACRADT